MDLPTLGAPPPGPPAFTCPRCGAVSYNRNDLAHRYCGRCHAFVDDPAPPGRPPAMRRLPFALVVFVFMCSVGAMFYALENPTENRVLFVVSIALVVALPHVPTKRD